jgi:hypothetical protein
MFNVLIDASVWLDLAGDQKQTPLLSVVEDLIKDGLMNLVVPNTLITEFRKNRNRVAKSSAKSLSTHFQVVKEAIRKVEGNAKRKELILSHLSDLDHRIPILGGAAEGILERIDKLLTTASVIEASDAVKVRAAERALHRKAPCHQENKNSMADAVLIETYFECVRAAPAKQRFAFVTHNKHDFSLTNGNQKLPHADLAASFSRIKSMYFINLAQCLRRIEPMRMTHFTWEQEWSQEPRSLTEILKAMDTLTQQIWYNRHMYRAHLIEKGKIKIVDRGTWEKGKRDNQHTIIDEIWRGALKTARATEKQLGKKNVGPWTDFEWGMLNGKLSALRWMLGEDWDQLYT